MKWSNKGHEFDEIGYLLEDKKHIFLYGAGEGAWELVEVLEAIQPWTGWNIHLVDRDRSKQQEGRFGYPVLSPEMFFSMEKEQYFVIANAMGKTGNEIYDLLKKKLPENIVIFQQFYFLHTYLLIYFVYVHDMVFFTSESILPLTVCNLNCRDCLNFTPYIKEHYVESLDTLKKNVDLFFNAVELIYRFQITGGEPFLYEDLLPLIEYIDENYREKIIRFEIVTNGTIIPDDRLCKVLKEKEIYVILDDYRMALEDGNKAYERVSGKLQKHDILYMDNSVDRWMRMYIPEEDDGKQYSEEALQLKYDKCDAPWSSLKCGRLSACNYAMYAETAGICNGNEDESYDLRRFSQEKKKELIEFRLRCCEKGYMEFCRKCGGWIFTNERWCGPAIQV
ncbi:MAG: radical SAM protein [Firmicutes bacterium]|nr:radical SAM protein [Bacillota bacterium]